MHKTPSIKIEGQKKKYDKLIMDIGKSFREQIKG